MKIALDYDGTYTADKTLWGNFVSDAKKKKHDIRFVTYRDPLAENDLIKSAASKLGIKIVYTSGTAKRKHCEGINWEPHIWIDDKPESVTKDSKEEYMILV